MQLYMQADGMKSKTLVVILIVLLAVNGFTAFIYIKPVQAVEPKFYVDDDYDGSTPGWQIDHFDKIQDAINKASEGDRIIVYDGTYPENLIINKTSLNVFGEDRDTTIINGGGTGDVVTISNGSVDISTFTIKNSGSDENDTVLKINSGSATVTDNIICDGGHGISISDCDNNKIYYNTIRDNSGDGIQLNHSDDNEITLNTVTDNANGIFLYDSSNNTIENYAIQDNSENGIFLNETSNDNTIENNDISGNTKNGIYLNDHCDDNIILSNQIYSNSFSGIRVENSSTNTLTSNTVNSNTIYGIMIVGSENVVQENTVNYNEEHGVFLFADDNSNISDNIIGNNTNDGIRLQNSTSDKISGNEIYGNSRYGVSLNFYALNNQIYDNYFHNNAQNARDISEDQNTWSVTKTPGTNIVGGSYIYGNYWDNFDETSEEALDSNGDGIADSAYTIYASNKDNGPLLDVTLPIMGTPQISPSSQLLGSYTNISITITDNIEVKEVYLNITDPDEQTSNFSIAQNKTGNVYYCYKQFSTIGNYSFFITTKDPRNWNTSSTGVFYIEPATDTVPPTIEIEEYGPSFDYFPNSHTFAATITDDYGVSDVYIEYWYDDSDVMRTDMENMGDNYYKKVIIPQGSPEKVFCIIYANDTSGNQQNTKNPYAEADGPYEEFITKEITFNGTGSFDLDGNITEYLWNFGDGTTGTGVTTTHIYSANGTYAITLTITDNDERTNIDTTSVVVKSFTTVKTSMITLLALNAEYNITLEELFYGSDTDGDGTVDAFTDPNEILHGERFANISGNASFLISVNGSLDELFIWDTAEDSITEVTHSNGTIIGEETDEEDNTITVKVSVNKSDWVYIEATDQYPDYSNLTVKTAGGTTISSGMVWRENNKIYVLDDPDTEYHFIYGIPESPATLEDAVFSPKSGSTINESNPTITITYNVPVELLYVELYKIDPETYNITDVIDIDSDLTTSDNKSFVYTPSASIENGKYELHIGVEEQDGTNEVYNSVVYYVSFALEEMGTPAWMLWVILGGIIAAGIATFLILRYKQITLESFVYIKNRKIIPFFKSVVFGPLSIDVDDKQVNKAEFYVDGKLKDTVTKAPYVWRWDEPAFMKHTIEAKVYDKEGTSSSSGEMTFFMFNPPRFSK